MQYCKTKVSRGAEYPHRARRPAWLSPGPQPSPSPVPTAAPRALLTVPGGGSGTAVLQELTGATCPPPGRSPQPLPTAAGQGEHPRAKQNRGLKAAPWRDRGGLGNTKPRPAHSLRFHLPASHLGSPLLHRLQPMSQDRDSLRASQACSVQQDRTWRLDHEARLKAYLCLKGVGLGWILTGRRERRSRSRDMSSAPLT